MEQERQLNLGQSGKGTDWMDAADGLELTRFAVSKGFGVSKMEAHGVGSSRGKHALWHQILGLDDEAENWSFHRDPARSLQLVERKFAEADRDFLILRYKFWFDSP